MAIIQHLLIMLLVVSMVGIAGMASIGGFGTVYGGAVTEDMGYMNVSVGVYARINQTQATLAQGTVNTAGNDISVALTTAWSSLITAGQLVPSIIPMYTSLIGGLASSLHIPDYVVTITIGIISAIVVFALIYALFKVEL